MSSAAPEVRKEPTLSKSDVEALLEREAKPESPVLSVYLDTDQSREVNIERGFAVVLKNMLRDIREGLDRKARDKFEEDAQRVRGFLEEYREVSRGLVIFCDESEGFFWHHEFNIRVRDGLWWTDTPCVRPLIEIMDEHERYGVVLTDRQQARLFTVYLGEIEEHREAFAKLDVKRIAEPGQEHAWAQLKIQHKADEHAHQHLKRVAEMLSRLARVHEFDRLILGGTVEATSELAGLLPKALRARVIRSISLPVGAGEAQVLQQTRGIEEEVERTRETELVEELVTAAMKRERAVLGLDDTLLALQEWRIRELVYADGFAPRGSQCTKCGALGAGEVGPCAYCGGAVKKFSI